MTRKKRKPSRKKRGRRTDNIVLLSLIFAFPVGLFLMWTDRCRWPRATKIGVSTFITAALFVFLSPITRPPEGPRSGVRIVSNVGAMDEFIGPMPGADFDRFDVYIPYDSVDYHIVVTPTPVPDPIYVYCNDRGEFYHTEKCYYTRRTTPKVTLTQALNAGFKRCRDCAAPTAPPQ